VIDIVPPASSQRDDSVSGIGSRANGEQQPRVLSIPLMLQA
jgi:hypothetical protein